MRRPTRVVLGPCLALVVWAVVCAVSGAVRPLRALNEYVAHYEPLSYQPLIPTSDDHSRAKRSTTATTADPPIAIEFRAYGRHFPLRLSPDSDSVFTKDLVIEASDGQPVAVSLDHIVSGQLATEPRSHVFGAIRDGVFEGRIRTQNDDTFYVERAHHYFDSSDHRLNQNKSLPFHSVIYSAKHVADPYRHKRSTLGEDTDQRDHRTGRYRSDTSAERTSAPII